jgi:hypothetical protein
MTILSTLAMILLLVQSPAGQTADNRILASTGDWTITAQDFETILATLPQDARNFYSRPENRRAFLGDLIQMWVMADEARAKGIDAEPALKAVVTYYQQNLIAQEYRRRVAAATTVSDEDVESFYRENSADFTRLKVSHILILNSDSPTVQAQNFQGGVPAAEARRLIAEVKAKIEAGGNFEDLAREYSGDPGSAANGGDLGFITKGQFVPEVERAAFNLTVGADSDIIESSYGFHIVRLSDRALTPLSDVKEQIRQRIVADQVAKGIEARVTASDVKIDEDFFNFAP